MSARDAVATQLPATRMHVRDEWADEILKALTAAGYRILAPGEVDDVAASMWRAEAEDAGAPASVAKRRTRAAFDDQSEELKARWRKFARAAIRTLTDGGHDA